MSRNANEPRKKKKTFFRLYSTVRKYRQVSKVKPQKKTNVHALWAQIERGQSYALDEQLSSQMAT